MSPRIHQGTTKAPRLGLQATILRKINTNQSRRYDGTKTSPATDSHIKKMLLKIGVAAMKVPRLGLQVNYTQDSSRHNNNAENNEIQTIFKKRVLKYC